MAPPDSQNGAPLARRPATSAPATALDASNLLPGAVSGRQCAWCRGPLPPRRRRFCTDECRRKGQKRERVIETGSYADGVVRLIASMGKRASADLDALEWLAGAADYARKALAMAVDGCRARGYSDAEIGAALGITRQAVGQRFGRKRDVHAGQPESGEAG
jgi:predicted nucleic acid-binding Zn ribbon protein